MVSRVADADADFSEVPDLYEAGSPNYPGVVGVLKAIEILTRNELGFKYIVEHEQKLLRVALDELKALGSDVILYGDNEKIDDRVGILVFNLVGRDNRIVAELLAGKKAVAVRHAKFCAHTYVDRLLKNNTPGSCGSSPGMVRASFGVYTTEKEVRDFIDAVKYLLDNPNLFDKHERETVDSAESRFSLPNDRG
jgi:selenocysteine lyase/cysteine desulfurase